jgi:hypothetical protein
MEMPNVQQCEVQECCYNVDRQCHALAINVGENVPRCDTFTTTCSQKSGDFGASGRVGACKVGVCRYNMNLECQANGITVGRGSDPADCLTFEPG